MRKSGLIFFLFCSLLFVVILTGCGGGSGGSGAVSSGASLALTLNKATAASGSDTVTATVTLTSLNSQPVNGVSVNVDVTYNGSVIGSYSGNTNSSGVVLIPVPISLVATDRTVYFQAKSTGITSSSSVAVTVKAPVITVTLADGSATVPAAQAGSAAGITFTGAKVKFADSNNVGYSGATVRFTYTSSSGSPSGTLSHAGSIMAVGDYFDVSTDSYGEALLTLAGTLTAPSAGVTDTATFNYTISTTYGGNTYTKQGSVSVSVSTSAT